jgi:hypothetical protein
MPYIFNPIFDFTGETSLPNENTKQKSIASFKCIDHAIMGGISLSALKDVPQKNYASWSGVCQTDSGGFCGMRTLPFLTPLNATSQDGIYIDCKLASNDEPEQRMWKLTVWVDPSHGGEMVFQSQFDLKIAMDASKEMGDDWAHVKVPFDMFQLVRGPRLVLDGSKLDVLGGIFQIGMMLSKFKIVVNMTQLENFWPGFFDLHIQRIGFYQQLQQTEKDAEKQIESSGNLQNYTKINHQLPLPCSILCHQGLQRQQRQSLLVQIVIFTHCFIIFKCNSNIIIDNYLSSSNVM